MDAAELNRDGGVSQARSVFVKKAVDVQGEHVDDLQRLLPCWREEDTLHSKSPFCWSLFAVRNLLVLEEPTSVDGLSSCVHGHLEGSHLKGTHVNKDKG